MPTEQLTDRNITTVHKCKKKKILKKQFTKKSVQKLINSYYESLVISILWSVPLQQITLYKKRCIVSPNKVLRAKIIHEGRLSNSKSIEFTCIVFIIYTIQFLVEIETLYNHFQTILWRNGQKRV